MIHDRLTLMAQVSQAREHAAALDLVVPWTTPELTLAAMRAAGRLGGGLNAIIRLLKVQVVPYTLDLVHLPVYSELIEAQLAHFPSALPVSGEVRLARDFERGLVSALDRRSVVILATKNRPWQTRNESLATRLRAIGHTVVMVPGGGSDRCRM